MKVRNTLIFILILFAVIAGVMAVFPKDGIRIGENFVLHCPSFSDFLPSSAKEESTVNLDSLLSNQIDIDEHIPEKNPAKLKDMPEYEEQPDPTSDNVVNDAPKRNGGGRAGAAQHFQRHPCTDGFSTHISGGAQLYR